MYDSGKLSIIGSEFKNLYEKFTFLCDLNEVKLDNEENIKALLMKGFKIITKNDATT